MSTLTHSFNVLDAEKYGVSKAILLHNFRYWLDFNQKTGRGQRDGTTWCHLTSDQIIQHHSYLKKTSVKRWLTELVEAGELIRKAFAKKTGNHTYSYTMPEFIKDHEIIVDEMQQFGVENGHQAPKSLKAQNGLSKDQNGLSKKAHFGLSLRSINKDLKSNIYIYNTEPSEADKIQRFIDESENLSKDQIAIAIQDKMPSHWIKKYFVWKGITEDTEILDVLQSFVLYVRGREEQARASGERLQQYTLLQLEAKLNTLDYKLQNVKIKTN